MAGAVAKAAVEAGKRPARGHLAQPRAAGAQRLAEVLHDDLNTGGDVDGVQAHPAHDAFPGLASIDLRLGDLHAAMGQPEG